LKGKQLKKLSRRVDYTIFIFLKALSIFVPRAVSCRFSPGTVPACQQRRSPESRAHHFISMINTLHFMRIILRPLHPHVRAAQTSDPSPCVPAPSRSPPRGVSHPLERHIRATRLYLSMLVVRNPTTRCPAALRPPASLSTATSSATSSNPFLSCSLARPSVQPPPPRTQPIFFNVRQL